VFALAGCQTGAASQPSTAPPATSPPRPTQAPAPTLAPHVVAQWTVWQPSFLAFAFGSVWVTGHNLGKITRIDPVTNIAAQPIPGTGSGPESAIEVGDRLWVTGQSSDTTLIDPKTNTFTGKIDGQLLYSAYGLGSVWITTRDNKLNRYDPTTAELTTSIAVNDGIDECMNDVVLRAGKAWVISCDTAELIKVDPSTNSVVSKTPFATLISEAKAQNEPPTGKGTDSIWVMIQPDWGGGGLPTGLLRVDPIAGVGSTFLPISPAQAQDVDGFNGVTDEAVWMAGSGEINRVDIATNTIDATYQTAPGRLRVGVAFGSVWLRNYEENFIQRLDVQP